jgi:hypothetical protein
MYKAAPSDSAKQMSAPAPMVSRRPSLRAAAPRKEAVIASAASSVPVRLAAR